MSIQEIAESLEVASVTAKRTIRTLRDLYEAPVIYDRDQGGYRYDGQIAYELPGLWLTADELAALLLLDEVLAQQPLGLLAEALAPARQRIERIAQRRGIQLPALRQRLRLLRSAARDVGPHFTIISDALAQGRRLVIHYHARSTDRMGPREVSPQRLALYRDNWYLDAWCHAREDLRSFSLDRIAAAERLEKPAIHMDESALDAHLVSGYGIFAGTPSDTARLRFTPEAARWVAAERWHPEQRDQREDDGTLIRELPYRHDTELIRDLMRWGDGVEVVAPESLRNAVAESLRAAAAQYGEK